MRQAIERQRRLDCDSVSQVVLNLNCRDELIPILRGLQQVYVTPKVREAILKLVQRDVLAKSRSDRGREGLNDWCILVLAAVRLGCNLDYDKLHDLAENHRTLRSIMGIGEFDETHFSWKRIRDNVCLLQPATIESISQLIVSEGHTLVPDAVQKMRADSFVGENVPSELLELTRLETFIARTQQVREVAHRRVIKGEKVPNDEKLFSLFEPHTQLYKRGKAGEPVQFGRLVLVFEDGAGFLTQHRLLKRTESDRDVAVPETRRLQQRYQNRVEELSFDRGFHSPENHDELAKLVKSPCLPKPGFKQAAAQLAEQSPAASLTFRAAKQRHPGIESAIGGLQSGNGQKRCRDRGELGLERYLALGILGRNLHTFGRLLIERDAPQSEAARTQRAA